MLLLLLRKKLRTADPLLRQNNGISRLNGVVMEKPFVFGRQVRTEVAIV